jgi:hypothetical protein
MESDRARKSPGPGQRTVAVVVYLAFLLIATRLSWEAKWKVIATWAMLVYQCPVLGDYVARTVLALLYCALLPLGLGVRLLSDPLRLRTRGASSHWLPRPAPDETLTGASRQG